MWIFLQYGKAHWYPMRKALEAHQPWECGCMLFAENVGTCLLRRWVQVVSQEWGHMSAENVSMCCLSRMWIHMVCWECGYTCIANVGTHCLLGMWAHIVSCECGYMSVEDEGTSWLLWMWGHNLCWECGDTSVENVATHRLLCSSGVRMAALGRSRHAAMVAQNMLCKLQKLCGEITWAFSQ